MISTTALRFSIALLGVVLAVPNEATAVDYPVRPVKIIVPYTPGGGVDTLTRLMSEKLSGALGQPVVVENRPGAGASLGAEIVAKSPPDGYTLLVCTVGAMTINPTLYKDLRYDPLRDFEGVSLLGVHVAVMIVNAQLGVKTPVELIALAKSKPGGISGGHPGSGTSAHLALHSFIKASGANIVPIAYRASTQVTAAAASGELDMAFIDILPVLPFVKSGAVRIIGILGPDRTVLAPEVPTMKESGTKGLDLVTWSGIFAPAGTPREVIARLNQEIRKVLADSEIKKRFLLLGGEAVSSAPEEPMARVKREIAMWATLVREATAKVD
ncbi:MAG: hypothetical protein A3H27_09875 [Acidobacteria bacterium RIFCSPLOWO2_02_FULL_59_13]|nr:MAG: hypothetical protein A3H27_09875 [Acidobacteria bacterium RIFCSPLOWO2_02_FULL_59_13]